VHVAKIDDWAFLTMGIYLIVSGLTAKTLINEVDSPATEDERKNAKATPLKRIAVVGVGLAASVYAAIRLIGN
jgi:hypothetical protein